MGFDECWMASIVPVRLRMTCCMLADLLVISAAWRMLCLRGWEWPVVCVLGCWWVLNDVCCVCGAANGLFYACWAAEECERRKMLYLRDCVRYMQIADCWLLHYWLHILLAAHPAGNIFYWLLHILLAVASTAGCIYTANGCLYCITVYC